MKLRNKKTGEEYETLSHEAIDIYFFDEAGRVGLGRRSYGSIAELNEEWEDYEPKEPLIKDERIRKAVRAWAEMNDIRFIHMCSRTRKENARIVGQNALGRTFTMEIDNEYEIRVCFKDYKECYTIAELCGEEEE